MSSASLPPGLANLLLTKSEPPGGPCCECSVMNGVVEESCGLSAICRVYFPSGSLAVCEDHFDADMRDQSTSLELTSIGWWEVSLSLRDDLRRAANALEESHLARTHEGGECGCLEGFDAEGNLVEEMRCETQLLCDRRLRDRNGVIRRNRPAVGGYPARRQRCERRGERTFMTEAELKFVSEHMALLQWEITASSLTIAGVHLIVTAFLVAISVKMISHHNWIMLAKKEDGSHENYDDGWLAVGIIVLFIAVVTTAIAGVQISEAVSPTLQLTGLG